MRSSFCFFKEPACLFGIGTVCEDYTVEPWHAVTLPSERPLDSGNLKQLAPLNTMGSSLVFKRVSCRAKKDRSEEYWGKKIKKWQILRIWSVQKRKEQRIIRLSSVAKRKNWGLLITYSVAPRKEQRVLKICSFIQRNKWRILNIFQSPKKRNKENW